jgi:serine/threonine protein kinase
MTTHYEVLNVDKRASLEVIQAAFKALAVKYHPDKPTGNAKLFAKLTEARDVLSDERKRREYDVALSNQFDGKKLVGSYEVLKFLAEGAMGRTYVVRHTLTKKLAVLKACLEISPEHEEVMLNEAQAIWDIRHYAFPAVREVLKLDDGALAIVMSYIPGPTIEQAVKQLGPIDPIHVGWMFERLLAGLNFLHANGVVHGDLKPQNIILQPENHGAVMIDFGLAMIKPNSKSKNIGYTEHFSPPEQLWSDRKPLIPETDLYALGMTMAYALTGKLTTPEELSRMTNIPGPLTTFIRRLTDRDVLKRPNWQKTDLLSEIGEIRTKAFGSRGTRGKSFPKVTYDIIK